MIGRVERNLAKKELSGCLAVAAAAFVEFVVATYKARMAELDQAA